MADESPSVKLLHESLDKLALQFETSHPEFFQDWFNARVIVDNAATRPGDGEASQAKAA